MNVAIHSSGKKPNAVSVSTGKLKEVWIFAILSLNRKENAVEFKRAGCSIRSSGKKCGLYFLTVKYRNGAGFSICSSRKMKLVASIYVSSGKKSMRSVEKEPVHYILRLDFQSRSLDK